MSKSLTKKQDPLIQFRVSEDDYKLIVKLAAEDVRTLPNWAKSIVLKAAYEQA